MTDKENFYSQPTYPELTNEVLPDKLPEKIGPYKIEALLNKGGMSYLYLGIHPETHTPLTVKVLSRKYITHPEVVQRFLNEAEIISMSNHPNIIKMHGHGEWEGGLYIAMEYVEGVSLRKLIQTKPLSLKRALEMVIDIAYALCHLHTHGVIHRDLKPENILVTELGEIKVIDFGIAQLLTEKEPSQKIPRQGMIGTPIYISPEQKENPETVSFPSDIYSLGIISYELILGKLSLGHIHLSLMPKGMQPILHKCLQPKPQDRYQDIVDFITDVSSYLNSPALHKDKIAGDRLSELSEEMRRVQSTLFPKASPDWSEVEVGISLYQEMRLSGIYFDLFEINTQEYGIIMGESSGKGVEGFLNSAIFKGMVAAARPFAQDPEKLVAVLNELLMSENIGPIFHFVYLTLNRKENKAVYISCGAGNLWVLLHQEKMIRPLFSEFTPLGIEKGKKFHPAALSWKEGDLFMLSSFPLEHSLEEKASVEPKEIAFHEHASLSSQQLADLIVRKARLSQSKLKLNRTLALICIRKKKKLANNSKFLG